jgi:hypothetical protein
VRDYVNRLKDIKRRKKPNRADWKKYAGDLWLEHAFGWMPFIHDLEDGRKAFNSLADNRRVIRISVGDKDMKRSTPSPYVHTFTSTAAYMSLITTYKREDEEIVRYRGAVIGSTATTARDRLARFGFTPSEFIPTAWELLPWSFLVDYFVNIGDLISAGVTNTSKVAYVSKSSTQKATLSCETDFNFAALAPFTTLAYSGTVDKGSAIYESKVVTRRSNVGIPYPTIRFSLPGSDMRLMNIAALLATVNNDVHHQNPSRRNWRI